MEENKKKKETATINIRLPKTDLDLIRELAAEDGRTMNNFICRIIHNYLDMKYLANLDNSE